MLLTSKKTANHEIVKFRVPNANLNCDGRERETDGDVSDREEHVRFTAMKRLGNLLILLRDIS